MTDPRRPAAEPDDTPLDAGAFLPWLAEVRAAIAGRGDTDVACDTCTACCTSAQFVHVGPDEHDALAHIPAALLFPAPGAPPGHRLLGYDEAGRCPLLGATGCTIYEHRPRTCRTYDCRVFAAADVVPDDKPAIAARATRWRFSHPTPADEVAHAAVRTRAARLADDPELPVALRPRSATGRAVLAVETAEV